MDTLQVQSRIRQNAEEMSSYLTDLSKWEKKMQVKDSTMRDSNTKKTQMAPRRSGAGTIHTTTSAANIISHEQNHTEFQKIVTNQNIEQKAMSAARHTYDVGYKKWENYDPDKDIANNVIDVVDSKSDEIERGHGTSTYHYYNTMWPLFITHVP